MNWEVDKTALIELLGKTIYRPENVLVEIVANSYDADASIVKIMSSGENKIVQILDNGCGMDEDDLKVLVTIAKSKKKELIYKKQLTPKFKRQYLGSFGIGIISFLSLGNKIKIFTKKKEGKTLFVEITRKIDETTGETIDIPITSINSDADYSIHLIEGANTESGTTIEIENSKLDFSSNFKLLKHKLSNLPLSSNFKIFVNNSEIAKEDYPSNMWENKSFEIELIDIDPSYKSKVELHVYYNPDSTNDTIEEFKRGIFFNVHGRTIEYNLYQKIRSKLTSPGSIDARLTGYIEADYLFSKIQANREDFFENRVIEKISELIEPKIQELINDFLLLKNYVSEEAYILEFNRQREEAISRIKNEHKDLSRLGLKFKYEPVTEQELILIIAELCQLKILNFEIIRTSGGSHIDCFVQWPIAQNKRMPDFVGHLEIETYLHKFFTHQHDYRTKPEICCWMIDERAFEREIKKYKKDRPESIESVELIEPKKEEKNHFNHQKEVYVKIRKKHDEYELKVLRVYVVSEIIKNALSPSVAMEN